MLTKLTGDGFAALVRQAKQGQSKPLEILMVCATSGSGFLAKKCEKVLLEIGLVIEREKNAVA